MRFGEVEHGDLDRCRPHVEASSSLVRLELCWRLRLEAVLDGPGGHLCAIFEV